jgi:membrane protease YdiL (CAAX protease family)
VFGLLHVVPFGEVGIAVPQVIGGVVMAAAFAIRWSVISAMVVHAMGNLFVGNLLFIYVRLFETCPTLYLSQ